MSDDEEMLRPALQVTGNERTLLPGDILLVTSSRVASISNRYGQGILSGKLRSRFSHVALSLGGGLVAESLTADGVSLKLVEDFREKTEIEDGVVLRPADRTPLQALDGVFKSARYYHGARYNWLFMLPKPTRQRFSRLFCSEFVSRVYQELGYPEFRERHPERFLPIHFEEFFGKSGWKTLPLAELLKEPSRERFSQGGVNHDPRIEKILEGILQREIQFEELAKFSEEQRRLLLDTNEQGAELTRTMARYVSLQLPRREKLLKRLGTCETIAQKKDVLEKAGIRHDWSALPDMISFLDGLPKTPSPPAFAWENADDRERLINRTLQLHIVIAEMMVTEFIHLITLLEAYVVFPDGFDASDHQAVAARMTKAISFLTSFHDAAGGPILTEGVREQLGESLALTADAMGDYADAAAGDPRRELWFLLAKACMGLGFIEMAMQFRPQATIEDRIADVLKMGMTFELHRSSAAMIRGD